MPTLVVCDIPLLFETGLDRAFDCIILVDASDATRLDRLMTHRALSRTDAERMMAAQLPADGQARAGDYVLANDGSLESLNAAVDALWRTLDERAHRDA